jgi:phosphoglycolate phosphatase-like HAD superfamily hydrolase
MTERIVAVDGDGVVVDYRQAYPAVWRAAFGGDLKLVRPDAYHAHTAYGITWESAAQEAHFFKYFDEEAWSNMPLMDGVEEGCELLVEADWKLVCVSSMNPAFEAARKRNFERYKLPISEVYAVKRHGTGNPKKEVLERIRAKALADDLKDNFEGLSSDIHRAFINYRRFDCPSLNSALVADSEHGSFLDFARYWAGKK